MTTTMEFPMTPTSATQPAVGARVPGRFRREVGYLLSGLPLGTAAFVLLVTGFSLGVSTLVIALGVPVLGGTLAMARYFARVESAQIEYVTGRALPPLPERTPRGGWAMLADAQGWRDLLHAVVMFPVRVTTFSLSVSWMAGAAGGLTYGLWSWSLPRDENDGLADLAFGWSGRGPDIAFMMVLGAFFLATCVPVIRGLVAAQTGLGRVLLRDGGRL
ncbi:sensor domain-containing protein [Streptomyces boncukensis]|uniref:Putative sensor domain-containing protein n=1 Tax=Streptomyces boncukensis TaxID=2711219 RepID=A0A6G4WXN2_9ACTN|nr:sensor domain-containing protein [Streptomyces boncukensis]NGO69995.1 hypothetical protein [Streptomyces boncukensis]